MVSWVARSNGVGEKWRAKDEAHAKRIASDGVCPFTLLFAVIFCPTFFACSVRRFVESIVSVGELQSSNRTAKSRPRCLSPSPPLP